MAFRALWQTPNRANARLKATLGGFHGPLTFFIENQSFFDNCFNLYPIGEKTEVADSEKRTPEVKFRLFFSTCQKIAFSQKYIFCSRLPVGEGLVNLVLFTVAKENRENARLKATKTFLGTTESKPRNKQLRTGRSPLLFQGGPAT